MSRFLDALAVRIAVARWDALPPVLWFLVASPLLRWALGCGGRWFVWPRGAVGWWRWG